MMSNLRMTLLWLVLACLACFGQSKFNNQIEPGVSTRADVARFLGQPVGMHSAEFVEYSPPEGCSQLLIGYRSGSQVVERVEAHFSEPLAKEAMIEALKVSSRPALAKANSQGKLVEYFDSEALGLTYAMSDVTSGVVILSYYSRELMDRELGKPARGSGGLPDNRTPEPPATGDSPSTPASSAAFWEEAGRRIVRLGEEVYQKLVKSAWDALQKGNFAEVVRLGREATAMMPARPEGFQVLGLGLIDGYQDIAGAESAMRAAIKLGNSALLRVCHDHDGFFRTSCWGWLYLNANGVSYRPDDGRHLVDAAYSSIKEAGMNGYVGAPLSAYHIKITQANGTTATYNFAPSIFKPAPSHLFLQLVHRR